MTAIITFFETIINFLGMFIDSIVWLVTMLPSYYSALTATVAFIPPVFVGFFISSISLTLLFAIIRFF